MDCMAWGWRDENGQRNPFCGDEKKWKFCVGNAWERPHESPRNIFCVGMRGEMCGVYMCGSVIQGCILQPGAVKN